MAYRLFMIGSQSLSRRHCSSSEPRRVMLIIEALWRMNLGFICSDRRTVWTARGWFSTREEAEAEVERNMCIVVETDEWRWSEEARRAHCQSELAECCWRSSGCSRQHFPLKWEKYRTFIVTTSTFFLSLLNWSPAALYSPTILLYTKQRTNWINSLDHKLHAFCAFHIRLPLLLTKAKWKQAKTPSGGDFVETAEFLAVRQSGGQ